MDARTLLRKRVAEIGSGRFVGKDEEKVTLADVKGMQEDDYRVNGKRSLDRILDCQEALES